MPASRRVPLKPVDAKLGLIRQDHVRAQIQATQIVNRLTGHIEGKIEMQASQVTAALGLLRKVVPDLSVTRLEGGDSANPVSISFTWQLPTPPTAS